MCKKFVVKTACEGQSGVAGGTEGREEPSDCDASMTALKRGKEERRVG